jgi:hypothetical protein
MLKVRFVASGARAATVACCLGFAALAAHAAPPPASVVKPAMPDDPAKVAAARQFITLYHPRMDPKNVAEMVDKGMARAVAGAKKLNPKLDEKKYEKELRAKMLGSAERGLNLQAHVVSRHFTLQELQGLIAFFSSPLGRKFTGETPRITREVMFEKVQNSGARGGAKTITVGPSNPAPGPTKPKK